MGCVGWKGEILLRTVRNIVQGYLRLHKHGKLAWAWPWAWPWGIFREQ
jgi:hypothetical protein